MCIVYCECLINILYNVKIKYKKFQVYFWYIESVDNLEKYSYGVIGLWVK